jgi:flavin reductase (DIM6/NTAB) family NADH-FMN oxidoreductase RutF
MKIDPAQLNRKEAHELFVGAVIPRPIAWVSTVNPAGIYNLAPFSFFMPMSVSPAMVGLAIGRNRQGRKKDTLINIESIRDFVVNMVVEGFAEAMNQTACEYPSEVDEFKEVRLTAVKSDLVKSPRLAESPVNLECRLDRILEFGEPSRASCFVIGEVLRVHVKDEFWADGEIQFSKLNLVGRLGGDSYCRISEIFEMKRPEVPKESD